MLSSTSSILAVGPDKNLEMSGFKMDCVNKWSECNYLLKILRSHEGTQALRLPLGMIYLQGHHSK